MTMIKLLSNNWIKITVGLFVASTAIYDGMGDLNSVAWAVLYYAIIYVSLALFCYKASKHANNTQEMLIGYGFSIFCMINWGLVVYAGFKGMAYIGNEPDGAITIFWDILNHTMSIYFMLAVGMTTSYGAYFANKLIK